MPHINYWITFAILSLVGTTLAATVNKRWAMLAIGVPAFMVQHALQGWCPPLAILRRKGFRTSKEINDERFALKSLRGDFAKSSQSGQEGEILDAVRSWARFGFVCWLAGACPGHNEKAHSETAERLTG
jgi:hypothetical protein